MFAIPLPVVRETMRMSPVTAFADAPGAVLGAAVVRGIPVPVLDVGVLLKGIHAWPGRLVVIDVGGRQVALGVSEVVGVRAVAAASNLPPLLRDAGGAALAAVRMLDGALVAVLETACLLSDTELPPPVTQTSEPA